MSAAARGAYIALLCDQWTEGPLCSDPQSLADRAGMELEEFEAEWRGPLGRCFGVLQDGRIANERLERERVSADEVSAKRREGGRRGRSLQLSQADPGPTPGPPQAPPGLTPGPSGPPEVRCGEVRSFSSGSGSDAPAGAREPRGRRGACSLDEQLAEFEFSTLRSDVIEAARDWRAARAEGGKDPWGPRQWRPALRRAIRDPEGFIAACAHSGDNGYSGLVTPRTASGSSQGTKPRQTAREASDDEFYAAWDRFMDQQGIPKAETPCSTSGSPSRLSAGSETSRSLPRSGPAPPPGTNGSAGSTPR